MKERRGGRESEYGSDVAENRRVLGVSCRSVHLLTTRLVIVRLLKEEICGQLLILVAGKVGLDDAVALESKETELLT